MSSVVTIMLELTYYKVDKSAYAAGCISGNIYILSPTDEKECIELKGASAVTSLMYPREFSKEMIIAGYESGNISVWKLNSPKLPALTLNHHNRRISGLLSLSCFNFKDSKNQIISISEDKAIRVWDISKSKDNLLKKEFYTSSNNTKSNLTLTHIVPLPDYIQEIFQDSTTSTQNQSVSVKPPTASSQNISQDSTKTISSIQRVLHSYFVLASKEGFISYWNYSEGLLTREKQAHDGPINDLISLREFENDCLASCGEDAIIQIIDVNDPQMVIRTLKGHNGPVIKITYIKKLGQILASLSTDRFIRIWSIRFESTLQMIDTGLTDNIRPKILYFIPGDHDSVLTYTGKKILGWQLK